VMKRIKVIWNAELFRLINSYERLEGALCGLLHCADGDINARPKLR
jgi:hypothetical protein